jgi:cysteine desulfurase
MGRHIYLDYNASTPVVAEVRQAMDAVHDHYGNPSSTHWAGRPARQAVDDARCEVAALIGASPDEVVFTGGGSEANNHALKGVFFAAGRPLHVVISAVEHPAITEPCRFLERLGARVTVVPVDRSGMVDPDEVARAITSEPTLVSIMHANNEVGTIEPIAAIAERARTRGALVHTDAAQSVGKVPIDVEQLGVDLLTIAGHKLYAPKGVGALYVRGGVVLEPLIHGAGQESGRRAGTEALSLLVGLGAACRLARLDSCETRLRDLQARLWRGLQRVNAGAILNGHTTERLPNTLNVSFPGIAGYALLDSLFDVAASAGSACHAGLHSLSPVLRAMGVSPDVGLGAVRFSVGRPTTIEEVDAAIDAIGRALSEANVVFTRKVSST